MEDDFFQIVEVIGINLVHWKTYSQNGMYWGILRHLEREPDDLGTLVNEHEYSLPWAKDVETEFMEMVEVIGTNLVHW